MDTLAILMNGLWAGLFAAGLAILLTAPIQYLAPTFLCGFIGRGVRDVCTGLQLNVNWSTVIAAFVVVLVALALTRRRAVFPVVLICAVLPLGAAVAMFNLIFALMRISSAQGIAINEASIALTVNAGKVFVTSLAIALGLGAGMTVDRLLPRKDLGESP